MAKHKKRSGILEVAPGQFVVQVARQGKRVTRRVQGATVDAERIRAELLLELERAQPQGSTTPQPGSPGQRSVPTLKEWLRGRYAERSRLLHKESTADVFESYVRYLIYYLGDRPLDEVARHETINWYTERRIQDGALSFALRKDGQPRRPRVERVSHVAINKTLSILRAALNLAFKEGLLAEQPRVELLPEDDARPIVPPSDTELNAILDEARAPALLEVAPLLPEAIELAVETGLRKEELFRLTWRSVDTSLGPNREGAIRVEEQTRSRLVGGKKWTPKNGRYRVVPLSPRAREILADLRKREDTSPSALIIPNTEGCPYVRLQSAGKGSGTAAWRVLKEAMGHGVRWHSLRHLFAVRCLQRGIPIAVVSQWMGHSDVNLTVKRYGRFAAEAKEQFAWINALAQPVEALAEARKPRLEVAR
ncbi:MAG TPA: tyrosine-type recombinase/integrase [Myxococcaceae bacterium]